MNDLKFKRFLDAEIDKAKPELQKQFKAPWQLDLAASELATSITIVYDHIVEVISVINNDYGALYLILVQQTVNFKKTMEFYLPKVNRLIDVAAAIHGVSVCSPLMSHMKSDYCGDKIHHSKNGVMRLFALHHKVNNKLRRLMIKQEFNATTLTDVLSSQVSQKTPPGKSTQFGERIPKIADFYYENYFLTPARKYMCIKSKGTSKPYHFSGKEFPKLSLTLTDSMYRAAVAKFPSRCRINRHGSTVAISPGSSYVHWAKNLKAYEPLWQCRNTAAIIYVTLGTNDVFFLEKRMKTLFKKAQPLAGKRWTPAREEMEVICGIRYGFFCLLPLGKEDRVRRSVNVSVVNSLAPSFFIWFW